MKKVEFLRHTPIYNAGEIAGFDDVYADTLIHAGAARLVETTHAPPPPHTQEDAHQPRPLTREQELTALGVDTRTKEDTEEDLRQKALNRPPKDRMVKSGQTK